jgi:putative ABC transport system permease protein
MLLRLTLSNFRIHKIRIALTVAAIALSVSLVVAVTSGYASVNAAAQQMLTQYLGSTDVQISKTGDARAGLKQSLLDEIRADPDVIQANGRLEIESRILTAKEEPIATRTQITGIERPQDMRVEMQRMEEGRWFDASDSNEAVVDQVALRQLGAKLGDELIVPSVDRQVKLKIVGVVHKPGVLASFMCSVYMPLQTMQNLLLPEDPRRLTRIMIDLRVGADHEAFVRRWRGRVAEIDPAIQITTAAENRAQLDQNLQSLNAMSYLGGTVSMLAATFIIFSALSMGVSERQRTLAMMRAIGALRHQLGSLVIAEGLCLAAAGVLIGVPLGLLWVELLTIWYSAVFTAGAAVSVRGIAFAVVGAFATALLASFLPAWSAMRVSPLEAMTPLASPTQWKSILISTLCGLVLLSIDPLILFSPLDRSVQFYGHFALGLPALMIGFFLLAPVVVVVFERLAGPIIAAMFGLRYAVLRQQLSGGVWRAAGTCAALMVSLSILIVMQTQGTSAIQGWKLPTHFPDIFIWAPLGLSPADQEKLAHVEGIKSDEFMPIAMASPEFGSNPFALVGAALMPNATMFFGVDPDLAMQMMELDFREGTPQEAARQMKLGRHVIVTQEYQQLKHLGVGDTISLKTNKGVVDFTICGVVWSPGIDVITSTQDLNTQFERRTAASIFGSLADAREYFGVERAHLFAANLQLGIERTELLDNIKKEVKSMGMEAGDVRQIKATIQHIMTRMLLLVSTIAYASMAVAALGVANTIMASIRSRRWHFGILRSIGVTRSQLLRIVLAEAVLVGVLGIALGAAAGFQLCIDARQSWLRLVGYGPPLVVPWGAILIGVGAVMLASIAASLWPAVHVAKTEPLALLQSGRASA